MVSGSYRISTDFNPQGTHTDTEIAIYDGSAVVCDDLTTLGTALACDQDSGNFGSGFNSIMTVNLTGGTTYYVQVSGYNARSGAYGLSAELLSPSNNGCFEAIPLEIGIPLTSSTKNTTATNVTNACTTNNIGDVWFSYAAPNNASSININTTAGSGDAPALEVYSGTCSALVPLNLCASASGSVSVTPGQTYYIQAFVPSGANRGTFSIVLDSTLSTQSVEDNRGLIIYPNPTIGSINLNTQETIQQVRLLNILGQEVYYEEVNATAIQLDLSNLPASTYFLQVLIDGRISTQKVIKKN